MQANVRMLIKLLLATLMFLVGSVSPALGVSSLESVTRQSLLEHRVAGASIARIEDGQLAELIVLGNSSADGSALKSDAVFQTGSISKSVAAWAVMTLVRDQKIELDEPIAPYLSRWAIPLSEYSSEAVTLRRLLSHTAGLSVGGYPGFAESTSLPSLEGSLQGATNGAGEVRLIQAPGQEFRYSGGGYTLLQLLIEEVSGQPFHEYVESAVLQPLGMNSSSYQPDPDLLLRRVKPHGFDLDLFAQHHFRAQAAASLHSTAGDLATFLIANMVGNSVLTSNELETLHSEMADAGFAKAGLGFFIQGDGTLFGHGGANQGWRADILFSKSEKSGLVVLTNSESGSALISTVRCFWDSEYGPGKLQKACRDNQAEQLRSRGVFSILSGVTLIVVAALIIWLLSKLLTKRSNLGLPQGWHRRVLLLVLCAFIGVWASLLYTSLGARLFSGFPTQFATVNYLPPGFENFSHAIIGLCVTIALLLLSHKSIK